VQNSSENQSQKGRRDNVLKSHTSKPIQVFLWILSISWLAFLVWMSSQNGPATTNTSMRLARFVVQLFGISATKLLRINQLFRTLAHFVGFFILGGVVHVSARMTWSNQRHRAVLIVVLCSVIAVLDEVKKVFISGRHLSWLEAGLNVLGVICGVAISLGILWLMARRKTRRGVCS
jgi:VanZ family protein